jgi:hypothetical protein
MRRSQKSKRDVDERNAMPIDPQKLNATYNQLKDLVGPQGAFIVFCAQGEGDSDENVEIRAYGPQSRQVGLLNACGSYLQDVLRKQLNDRMQRRPKEPD